MVHSRYAFFTLKTNIYNELNQFKFLSQLNIDKYIKDLFYLYNDIYIMIYT